MATATQPIAVSSKTVNGIKFETRTYLPAKGHYQYRTAHFIDDVRVPASQYDSARSDAQFAEFVSVAS